MKEKCGKCKFWDELPNENHEVHKFGKCLRYPPTQDILVIMKEIKEWPDNGKLWPGRHCDFTEMQTRTCTKEYDWCGEFKPNGA